MQKNLFIVLMLFFKPSAHNLEERDGGGDMICLWQVKANEGRSKNPMMDRVK